LQLGFHPVAVVVDLFTKIGKIQHKMRNNTQNTTKTIQKHGMHKTENKNIKQKSNTQRILTLKSPN